MAESRLRRDYLDSIELLSVNDSTQSFPMHFHETYCISLIEKGCLKENSSIAHTNNVLISNPNEVHSNEAMDNSEYSFSTIYLSPELVEHITGSESVAFEKIIDDPELVESTNSLIRSIEKNPSKSDEVELHLYSLISSLNEQYRDEKNKNPFNADLSDHLKTFILDNLHNNLNNESMAKQYGMEKFAFIRWFKKNTGLSPYNFSLLCRVLFAKNMLDQGELIREVTFEAGFTDQSHFTNTFKRFLGITPGSYLRK